MARKIIFSIVNIAVILIAGIATQGAAEQIPGSTAEQTLSGNTPMELEQILTPAEREAAAVSAAFDAKIPFDYPIKTTLERIDRLFHAGSAINFREPGIKLLKEALDLCEKALEEHPDDYEVMWRYARGAYKYAEAEKGILREGCKRICREWGKAGFNVAKRAIEMEPKRIEAHFWLTACVEVYADSVGFITAIKEGFMPKSSHSMKKAYEIDKSYYDYMPINGLSMINHTPPWPLRNKEEAYKYFKEYSEQGTLIWEEYKVYIFSGKYLLTLQDDEDKKKGLAYLEKLVNTPNRRPFYYNEAQKGLKKFKD